MVLQTRVQLSVRRQIIQEPVHFQQRECTSWMIHYSVDVNIDVILILAPVIAARQLHPPRRDTVTRTSKQNQMGNVSTNISLDTYHLQLWGLKRKVGEP